jgi:hypothetical protein
MLAHVCSNVAHAAGALCAGKGVGRISKRIAVAHATIGAADMMFA